jgi:predicted NBD/HSP70 family sugar kinase
MPRFLVRKPSRETRDPMNRRIDRRGESSRVSASNGYVVGVDIGGTNLRVALADMHGNVLGKWLASTRSTSSAGMVVQQICEGVNHLLERKSVRRDSLRAVAAGAPGLTNAGTGMVIATSYLKGWRNVPLRNLLESALNVPAAVENDVRLAAIGEHWRGAARGIGDFAFLAIGTGIAAGIFVNGQLLRGRDWSAGEVGYMLVPGAPEAASKTSSPGSLENVIGGEGIKLQWATASNGHRSSLAGKLTATDIFEYALAGNPLAKKILDRSARILAYAVYNISLVLNSSLFVLGGGVGANATLLAATRRVLRSYNEPVRPKLAVSTLGQDAQLMGTIRLALDTAESHRDSKN